MSYDFDKDLNDGLEYENKLYVFFRDLGLTDIEQAPRGEFKDWDLRVHRMTYEVKHDRWLASTGNLCIETYSCVENNSPGWLYTSKADMLVVFYTETEFLFIPMQTLKEHFIDNPTLWKQQPIKQTWGTTMCFLCDVKKIPDIQLLSIDESERLQVEENDLD